MSVPQKALSSMRAAVDPVTGLIPGVLEIELERTDPDVFVVAATTAEITEYGYGFGVSSSGSSAGLTREAAEAAALGECFERYALALLQTEDAVFGTHAEMEAAGAIAPARWALFAPSQTPILERVGFSPFDSRTPIGWYHADNLTRRAPCFVPACLVAMPYLLRFADRGERSLGPAVSTGAACGATPSEAVRKGIYELVERDAFMIVWRNRLPVPRVRIDEDSALAHTFRERFERPGLAYSLYYTTLDLGLPSFFGVLINNRGGHRGRVVGGAAHSDPAVAVLKTLLELVQGLKWMDYRRDPLDEVAPDFSNIKSFDDRFRLYAFHDETGAALEFLSASPEIPLSSLEQRYERSRNVGTRAEIDRLDAAGFEVVALDVTSEDLAACGVSVVKTMIPGLETMEGDHRLPFAGGSRWNSVPMRLGLRSTQLDLADTNPYPHPYP